MKKPLRTHKFSLDLSRPDERLLNDLLEALAARGCRPDWIRSVLLTAGQAGAWDAVEVFRQMMQGTESKRSG